MADRNPLQVLKEARQIAADYGCTISERGGRYSIYRKTPTRPVWCGSCRDVNALNRLVRKITGFR